MDNCILVSNANQADANANGQGDACENDRDGDGLLNRSEFVAAMAGTGAAPLSAAEANDLYDGAMAAAAARGGAAAASGSGLDLAAFRLLMARLYFDEE